MLTLNPSYIVDARQKKKSVLLPMAQWNRVLDALEELEDVRAYDRAKASGGEFIPFEQAVNEIVREKPV
jgi:hypothetical protein